MISSKIIVDRNKNILQLYKQKYNNKKIFFINKPHKTMINIKKIKKIRDAKCS